MTAGCICCPCHLAAYREAETLGPPCNAWHGLIMQVRSVLRRYDMPELRQTAATLLCSIKLTPSNLPTTLQLAADSHAVAAVERCIEYAAAGNLTAIIMWVSITDHATTHPESLAQWQHGMQL